LAIFTRPKHKNAYVSEAANAGATHLCTNDNELKEAICRSFGYTSV